MKRQLRPLQQGNVDSLCSLYTTLNLRLLYGSLGREAAGEGFQELIEALPEAWNFRRLLHEGIKTNPDDMRAVLQAGGFCIRHKHRNPSTESLRRMRRRQPAVPIFITREDGFTHYSLALRIARGGDVILFDSFGFSRLTASPGSGFTLDGEPTVVRAAWELE